MDSTNKTTHLPLWKIAPHTRPFSTNVCPGSTAFRLVSGLTDDARIGFCTECARGVEVLL